MADSAQILIFDSSFMPLFARAILREQALQNRHFLRITGRALTLSHRGPLNRRDAYELREKLRQIYRALMDKPRLVRLPAVSDKLRELLASIDAKGWKTANYG